MARFARVVVPECAHHITPRGNARRVFYSTLDKSVYLGLLKQYSELYGLRILGYCLMTNHVHLVAVPNFRDSLAKTLREVHGRYARYRNAIDRGSGVDHPSLRNMRSALTGAEALVMRRCGRITLPIEWLWEVDSARLCDGCTYCPPSS
jgi:REP element-mobilizing transposase RayT